LCIKIDAKTTFITGELVEEKDMKQLEGVTIPGQGMVNLLNLYVDKRKLLSNGMKILTLPSLITAFLLMILMPVYISKLISMIV